MNTKTFSPCGGGSNLILGTGMENQIFLVRSPATIKFFSPNSLKMTLWCKIKSLPTQTDLYDPYMVLYTIFSGNYNFSRSTNKIPFVGDGVELVGWGGCSGMGSGGVGGGVYGGVGMVGRVVM